MYVTVNEADTFLSTELWAEAWLTATPENKTKALTKATASIDAIQYKGEKDDEDQVNEFPRSGQEEVPQDVKDACCHIALKFIEGRIPNIDIENARIKSDNFASGKVTYETNNMQSYILYGIPSYDAWVLLVKYIDRKGVVNLIRAS